MLPRCLRNRLDSPLKSALNSRTRTSVLNAYPCSAFYATHSKPPQIAFAFDIDGVLTQGSSVLPQAKRALKILNGDNKWKRQFPYILMTNGGGKPEAERCRDLSEKLESKIDETMFMQAHTIIGSRVLPYLERYQDKPIMVLGGVGDTCRRIAQSYGFENVLIPLDALAWNKDLWPFYSMTDSEAQVVRRDFDFPSTPIHAIFVFHDPRNWGLDTQICLDILRRGTKSQSAFSNKVQDHGGRVDDKVEMVFCNPDLLWKGGYRWPRLGQGGFREAFQGVHTALEGKPYQATQLGKPSTETYTHAGHMLQQRTDTLYGREGSSAALPSLPGKSIYMVGDNPESDIAGANGVGWSSILVHTGVYSPEDGVPKHEPTFRAEDVEEAVLMAFEREAGR